MPQNIIFQESFYFVNCSLLKWNATSINLPHNEDLVSNIGFSFSYVNIACKNLDMLMRFNLLLVIHVKHKNACKYFDATILRRYNFICRNADTLVHNRHQVVVVIMWKTLERYTCKSIKKSKRELKKVEPLLYGRCQGFPKLNIWYQTPPVPNVGLQLFLISNMEFHTPSKPNVKCCDISMSNGECQDSFIFIMGCPSLSSPNVG